MPRSARVAKVAGRLVRLPLVAIVRSTRQGGVVQTFLYFAGFEVERLNGERA